MARHRLQSQARGCRSRSYEGPVDRKREHQGRPSNPLLARESDTLSVVKGRERLPHHFSFHLSVSRSTGCLICARGCKRTHTHFDRFRCFPRINSALADTTTIDWRSFMLQDLDLNSVPCAKIDHSSANRAHFII